MDEEKTICAALTISIILVLILIIITLNDINKLEKGKNEPFADEKEKEKRADEVINSVGQAFKNDPNMSFDQSKSYLPNINAVEYKDVKGIVGSGQSLTNESLVLRW
jgi:hypothetical protein